MVIIMIENASEALPLRSRVRDLRDIPLFRVRVAYQDEVNAIVDRLVETPTPGKPPVASFSSAI